MGIFIGLLFLVFQTATCGSSPDASSVWLNIVSIDISISQSIFVAQVKLCQLYGKPVKEELEL